MTDRLADHTTLRVGGPARRLLAPTTEADLIAAVAECDRAGEPVLVLGGGSNVLVADEGFDGTVVKVRVRGIADSDIQACSGAFITAAAGEDWDAFVDLAVSSGWVGIEALSGIPGLVGSTPIQNVGAYGQEVGQTIARVRAYDRREGRITTFGASDCRFGYRWSIFKAEPGRWLVLSVTFQLALGELSAPIRYGELATRLGVGPGGRAPLPAVRDAVLALRRSKGMVLDPDDHDTWSAGSFFTNPVLTAEQADALPERAPRYPMADGTVKSSAAWLIENAGFPKGFGTPPATLSTKHTLAITNRGGATASDLLALARQIREGVKSAFGVVLAPEPVLVGCSLT